MAQRYLATIKRLFAYALAIVLVPFLSGAVGMGIRLGASSSADTNPPPYTGALPTPPIHNPGKRTAIAIAANSGTDGSDFLAPYGTSHLGVTLYDMSELALASVVDTYPHQGALTVDTIALELR